LPPHIYLKAWLLDREILSKPKWTTSVELNRVCISVFSQQVNLKKTQVLISQTSANSL